jgi:hypothetical protein
MKYAVETLFVNDVWENCWRDNHNNPTLFDSRDDAEQAIKDCITDCINAVEGGDMEDSPDPSEFRVVEVSESEACRVTLRPANSGDRRVKTTTDEPGAFTTQDVDRLLGLADQFLEDWEQNEGKDDTECVERRAEWNAIRPLLVAAPTLLSGYEDMAEIVEAYLVHKDVSDAAFADALRAHVTLVSEIRDAT